MPGDVMSFAWRPTLSDGAQRDSEDLRAARAASQTLRDLQAAPADTLPVRSPFSPSVLFPNCLVSARRHHLP